MTEKRKKNIILILADDLGYECLSCYGGKSYDTPNLNAMAASGTQFTHAYALPLCTPTRIQIMTGKYNFRNWKAFGILDPSEKTFGHYMQYAGYKTCITGKWQLRSYNPPDFEPEWRGQGMLPENAGFDEYFLWHAGHTEDKGSRYADPVILDNNGLRQDTEGKYGPDVGEGWGGMSTVHVVSRSVRDSAAMLDATHGPDLGAPYQAAAPARPYLEEIGEHPGKLRIALQHLSFNGFEVEPDCLNAVEDAAKLLRDLGHDGAQEAGDVRVLRSAPHYIVLIIRLYIMLYRML